MKKLELVEITCGKCHGLGTVDVNDEWCGYMEEDCTECGGSGRVYNNKKFSRNAMIILDCVV